jgi:hypothetical protein
MATTAEQNLITSVKKINNCSLRHFYKFDEKRARTPRWVIRFTSKLQVKKKMKLQSQSQPNFAEMILGWSSSKIVSSISEHRPRWPPQPNLI